MSRSPQRWGGLFTCAPAARWRGAAADATARRRRRFLLLLHAGRLRRHAAHNLRHCALRPLR